MQSIQYFFITIVLVMQYRYVHVECIYIKAISNLFLVDAIFQVYNISKRCS